MTDVSILTNDLTRLVVNSTGSSIKGNCHNFFLFYDLNKLDEISPKKINFHENLLNFS